MKNLLILALFIFGIDQTTKFLVASNLPLFGSVSLEYPYGGIPLFKNFLGIQGSIVYAENLGAAWSLMDQYPLFLLFLRVLLIGFLLFSFVRTNSFYGKFALTLILTGAIGNIFDTLVRGYVVDFFYFVLFGYSFPVFNVADIAITFGVIFLFFQPQAARSLKVD